MRSGRIAAFIAVLWTALLAFAETGSLSSDQWRQDLQFFALELPKRHINAYHHTPKSQFEAAVSNLDKKLAGMDYDETAIGFMRLAAMIGDAHTNVNFPAGNGLTFPLRLREFDGGFRVVAVAPGLDKALGAHLLKIDETPVDDACNSLSALDARDEHPWLRRALAATELISARLLHGVGIIPADTAARYTFVADDGAEFSLAVKAQSPDQQAQTSWVTAVNQPAYAWEPVHRVNDTFTYTWLATAKAVYCNIRSMRDLSRSAKELLDFVKKKGAEKLAIDLRQNPGGDYFEGLHHLIEPIAKSSSLNRKGHLFVLIGPLTGSAAMVNAVQFHTQTNAILVGEPIGAKPTSYAERRQMELPNSHLVVIYSVNHYEFAYNSENVVRPDQEVKTTWPVYNAGRDAALDWIFDYRVDSH